MKIWVVVPREKLEKYEKSPTTLSDRKPELKTKPVAWSWHWTIFSFDLFDRICEKRKTNGGDILRQITSKRLTICHGEVFSLVQQHLIREQILPGYNGAPELNNELRVPNKVCIKIFAQNIPKMSVKGDLQLCKRLHFAKIWRFDQLWEIQFQDDKKKCWGNYPKFP